MSRTRILPAALPLSLSLAAALPLSTAWAAPAVKTHHQTRTAKARTFRGPTIDVQYGPVQVSIVVKKGKISTVRVANAPDSARGQFLQGQAIPILREETLRAQSANIDAVSGATQTSQSFIESLQSAVTRAHAAKALK